MTSGGARARSGPPPDRNAIRNGRSGADWIRLPASGRQGDPPPWPLPKKTRREGQLWAELWRRPQALMWEAKGQELQVALYARSLREAERAGASVASRTLLLRQEEYLGLSEPGLARNRWVIVEDAAMTDRPADERESRAVEIAEAWVGPDIRERARRMDAT